MSDTGKQVKITQIRSLIGVKPKHRKTMKALGFKRMHHTIVHDSNPVIWGMIRLVRHLVRIEEKA